MAQPSDLDWAAEEQLAVPQEKNQAALDLLRQWMADESGYDEETWPALKELLEEDRLSARKRFHDS